MYIIIIFYRHHYFFFISPLLAITTVQLSNPLRDTGCKDLQYIIPSLAVRIENYFV
jgi:hypothetical protein